MQSSEKGLLVKKRYYLLSLGWRVVVVRSFAMPSEDELPLAKRCFLLTFWLEVCTNTQLCGYQSCDLGCKVLPMTRGFKLKMGSLARRHHLHCEKELPFTSQPTGEAMKILYFNSCVVWTVIACVHQKIEV